MTSSPSEPPELTHRLRQQLILAQVRIMELEDERDTLAPRVTELEALLQAAQQLADQKLDEAAHLARVLADTEAHAARLQSTLQQAQRDHALAQESLSTHRARLSALETEAANLRAAAEAQSNRCAALEANLAALKRTRSWRWTAWLRAIGRSFSR
ncbi:MAG: hypothetical protein KF897_07885 [Opitutaceae bacterium]|nr:hypothetical protein [Opitutaceae bacterium]